jgi:ankyrin repeat protein
MSGGDFKDMFGAAVRGDEELVRFHLSQGVDPDHVHPELQSTALVTCILAGQEAVARLLLDAGADPLLESALDEATPVEAARRMGNRQLVEHLVALGATDPGPAATRPGPTGRGLLRRRRRGGVSGSSRAPGAGR